MHPLHDFIHRSRGGLSIWLRREFEGGVETALLEEPDKLFDEARCQIIKDQRKITIGRISLKIRGRERVIYVKRYNCFCWRHRLESLFLPSAAVRALKGACILANAGFSTGLPVGAVEYWTFGTLTESFYLSEEVEASKPSDVYWREVLGPIAGSDGYRRRRRFLSGLAQLYRALHEKNIYHNDLKDANVLITDGGLLNGERYHLLDLEDIRHCRKLSYRRRIKNLVQLNRTLGQLFHSSQKLYWLREYLGRDYRSPDIRRKWIQQVFLRTSRKNAQKFISRFVAR